MFPDPRACFNAVIAVWRGLCELDEVDEVEPWEFEDMSCWSDENALWAPDRLPELKAFPRAANSCWNWF